VKKGRIIALLLLLILGVFVTSQAALGQTAINVIGTWGGSELEIFQKIADAAGVKINFNTTRELDAALTTAVQTNNLPDIAILPNPAKLQELAKQGVLKPLNYLPKSDLDNYEQTWIDLGSYAGKLYGVYFKVANKSVIWYNPKTFKANGWAVPKTWDELLELNKKIVASGKTPWSIGADIGWPLTDWVENIMVRTAGPEVYTKWYNHEIPWTDPQVKKAFETWGQIVGNPKNLAGGISGTLDATNTFQNAAIAVFQEKPKAYMYYEGDFIGGIVTAALPNLKPGEDIDFFAFPPINPAFGTPVVGGADVFVAFSDKPEVQKLMKFIASVEGNTLAAKNGFLSQNKAVPLSAYPNDTLRNSAKILTSAKVYVFDASDMMPSAVGNQGGFWDKCKEFLANPAKLDTILAEMEKLAQQNY
jgi:alpha-glucoside transport system substrate-binding protein